MKYRAILREVDESVMLPLSKSRGFRADELRLEQMYNNLWSQFGLDEKGRDRIKREGGEMPCVSEWAWTAGAREAFYSHPYHKAFVKRLKKMRGMTWGLWVLQAEPSDYTEDGGAK